VANLSIKEMINAGVHFGHQSKYWNPKMRPYIYTTYKKLHIINLEQSLTHFNSAITFVEKLTKNNAKILFVGTKRAARELIVKHAVEAKMPYVNNRWLGGMLTNFDTIKKSIAKLDVLKGQLDLATLNGLTKKESLNIKTNENKIINSELKDIVKQNKLLFTSDYIEINYNILEGLFIKSPELNDIVYPCSIDLPKIIQYYEYKRKV